MSLETEQPELSETEQRRKLVKKRLDSLMQSNPQLYYEATAAIARAVHTDIQNDENSEDANHIALAGLTVREIEMILAFR